MNGHWSPENTIFVYNICNCLYTLNSHMLSKSFVSWSGWNSWVLLITLAIFKKEFKYSTIQSSAYFRYYFYNSILSWIALILTLNNNVSIIFYWHVFYMIYFFFFLKQSLVDLSWKYLLNFLLHWEGKKGLISFISPPASNY